MLKNIDVKSNAFHEYSSLKVINKMFVCYWTAYIDNMVNWLNNWLVSMEYQTPSQTHTHYIHTTDSYILQTRAYNHKQA